MIFIDDLLTRRWWDKKPYPHGLGYNIPMDYNEMSILEEFNTLKRIKAMNIPFKVFIVGCVLELSKNVPEIKEVIQWLVDNKIEICGHGYFHTEEEYLRGYNPEAEKVFNMLKEIQSPPFIWRYPRHEHVNQDYIEKLGFKVEKVDKYLDESLLSVKSLEILKNNEGINAMVHSCYLTRPIRKYMPQ